METKNWYASKTLWVNLVAGGVTVAGVFGVDVGLSPETQAELVAGILVVVNIILRFVTNTGLRG